MFVTCMFFTPHYWTLVVLVSASLALVRLLCTHFAIPIPIHRRCFNLAIFGNRRHI
jgi:hypothetical protein